MLSTTPQYRPMMVVDMERSAGRGDIALQQNRAALTDALLAAFQDSGLDWDTYHRQDTGDGVRLVAGPGVQKHDLLHPFVHTLATRLRTHNLTAAPLNTIRVRVAVHAGDVHVDDGVVVGGSLEHLARLESAPELKAALANAPKAATVALAVSDHIYQEVVRHRYAGIDPDTYHRINFTVKETTSVAWLHLPGYLGIPLTTSAAPNDAKAGPVELAGIRADSVNIATGNSRVGEQIGRIGTRVDHVTGTVNLSAGGSHDIVADLHRQVAELHRAVASGRHTGELDTRSADAAEGELSAVDRELASPGQDTRGRVITALKKLKGLVEDVADLAVRVTNAIAAARSL
jgi:hypothetical protein